MSFTRASKPQNSSNEDDQFVGSLIGNKKYGFGLLLDRIDRFVQADFLDNCIDGIALICTPENKNYFGEMSRSMKNGVGIVDMDGKIYMGEFLDDQRHGVGLVEYSTGESKVGHYLDGCLEGYGEYSYPAKRYKYMGMFKRGVPNGKGAELLETARYAGFFTNGVRDGQGILVEQDGDEYVGSWSSGTKNGIGFEKYSNGDAFLGHFAQGKKHGHGIFDYCSGYKFIGHFLKGKQAGFGRLQSSDYVFIGGWKGNKKHGLGYEKIKEEIFFGNWAEGAREGFGYLITQASEYKGEFRAGQLHGRGILKVKHSERIVNFDRGVEVQTADYRIDDILEAFDEWDVEEFFRDTKAKLDLIERSLAERKVQVEVISSSFSIDFEDESAQLSSKLSMLERRLQKCQKLFAKKKALLLGAIREQCIDISHMKSYLMKYELHSLFKRFFDSKPQTSPMASRSGSLSRLSKFEDDPRQKQLFSGRTRSILLGNPEGESILPREEPRSAIASLQLSPIRNRSYQSSEAEIMPSLSRPISQQHSRHYLADLSKSRGDRFDFKAYQTAHGRDRELSPKSFDNILDATSFVDEEYFGWGTKENQPKSSRRGAGYSSDVRKLLEAGNLELPQPFARPAPQVPKLTELEEFKHTIEVSQSGKYILSFREQLSKHPPDQPFNSFAPSNQSKYEYPQDPNHMDDFEEVPMGSHESSRDEEPLAGSPPHKPSHEDLHLQVDKRIQETDLKIKEFNQRFIKMQNAQALHPPTRHLAQPVHADPSAPDKQPSDHKAPSALLRPVAIKIDLPKLDFYSVQKDETTMRFFECGDALYSNINNTLFKVDLSRLCRSQELAQAAASRIVRINSGYVVSAGSYLVVLDKASNFLKQFDRELNVVQTLSGLNHEKLFSLEIDDSAVYNIRYRISSTAEMCVWVRNYPQIDIIRCSDLVTVASEKHFFVKSTATNSYLKPLVVAITHDSRHVASLVKDDFGCWMIRTFNVASPRTDSMDLSQRKTDCFNDMALARNFAIAVGSDGSAMRGMAKVGSLSVGAPLEATTFEDKSLESVVSLERLGLQVIGGLLRTFTTALDDGGSLQVLSAYDNWAVGIVGVFSDAFGADGQLFLTSERDVKMFSAGLQAKPSLGAPPSISVSKEDNIFFEEEIGAGPKLEDKPHLLARDPAGKLSSGSLANHGSDRLSTASDARFDLTFESSSMHSVKLADPELSSDVCKEVFLFSRQQVVLVCADGLRFVDLDSRGSPALAASKAFLGTLRVTSARQARQAQSYGELLRDRGWRLAAAARLLVQDPRQGARRRPQPGRRALAQREQTVLQGQGGPLRHGRRRLEGAAAVRGLPRRRENRPQHLQGAAALPGARPGAEPGRRELFPADREPLAGLHGRVQTGAPGDRPGQLLHRDRGGGARPGAQVLRLGGQLQEKRLHLDIQLRPVARALGHEHQSVRALQRHQAVPPDEHPGGQRQVQPVRVQPRLGQPQAEPRAAPRVQAEHLRRGLGLRVPEEPGDGLLRGEARAHADRRGAAAAEVRPDRGAHPRAQLAGRQAGPRRTDPTACSRRGPEHHSGEVGGPEAASR